MFVAPITAGAPALEAFQARHPLELSTLPGVVLHFISLKACAERETELATRLAPAERKRALAISNASRRTAFIASRALLREALSAFVGGKIGPGTWKFGVTLHGKPHVIAPKNHDPRFNISYTRTVMVIAVSRKYELGVDIESLDPQAADDVPWHVLTGAERTYLRTLPEADRFLEFLRLWTLKEAYTKYVGLGAMLDFRGVEVSLDRVYASTPEGQPPPFVAPLLHQQVIEMDGKQHVFVVAAGKLSPSFNAAAARFNAAA